MHLPTVKFSMLAIVAIWVLGCSRTTTVAISPGELYNSFQYMYKKIGVYPDPVDDTRKVLLKNVNSGQCLDVMQDKTSGIYQQVIEKNCSDCENQLVDLVDVGGGYVSLRLMGKYCVGGGSADWSTLFVSTSEKACEGSPTHQWAIVENGDSIVLKQRETLKCLTSWPKYSELWLDNKCQANDTYQKYLICDPTGKKCWPPTGPQYVPATTT